MARLVALILLTHVNEVNSKRAVYFQQALYEPNAVLRGRYRFDFYRLTYCYDVCRRDGLLLGFRLTLKVRDAAVGLASDSTRDEKTNTGPVPLLHARARVKLARGTGLMVELDVAAAPQGRSEDVLLALERELRTGLVLRLGYWLLEGGADNG